MAKVQAINNALTPQVQRLNSARARFMAKFGQLILDGARDEINRIQNPGQLETLEPILETMASKPIINGENAFVIEKLNLGVTNGILRRAVRLAKILDPSAAVRLEFIIVNGTLKLASSSDITFYCSLATENPGAVSITEGPAKVTCYSIDKAKMQAQGYRIGPHNTPLPMPMLPAPRIEKVPVTDALAQVSEDTALDKAMLDKPTHWLAKVLAKELPAVYVQEQYKSRQTHKRIQRREGIISGFAILECATGLSAALLGIMPELSLWVGCGLAPIITSVSALTIEIVLDRKRDKEQKANKDAFAELFSKISAKEIVASIKGFDDKDRASVIDFLAKTDPAKELEVRTLLQQQESQETV